MLNLFHLVPLVLLTLFGYSAGAVIVRSGCRPRPGIPDLIVGVAACLFAIGLWGVAGGWWSLPLGVLTGLAAGALSSAVQRVPMLSRRFERNDNSVPPAYLTGKWRRLLRSTGDFQGRMLMLLFYFSLLTPFALLAKARGDQLQVKLLPPETLWLARSDAESDLAWARRQS